MAEFVKALIEDSLFRSNEKEININLTIWAYLLPCWNKHAAQNGYRINKRTVASI